MAGWKTGAAAAVATALVTSLAASASGGATLAPTQAQQVVDRSRADDSLRSRLGLGAGERLVLKYVVRDPDGTVHKRYDRTYRGLAVVGGDLVVHRAPDGRMTVDWASEADLSAVGSAVPRVSAFSASRLATAETGLASRPADAELVVYAVGNRAELAWRAVAGSTDARELVFVDAASGTTIAGWSDVHDARGTGRTLYSGEQDIPTYRVSSTRFTLRDVGRGNHRVFDAGNLAATSGTLMRDRDNVWGNFKPSNRQSAAASVAYGHRITWDFYKTTFGRNGIRDDGTTPRSFVHFGTNVENAYFDDACYCMVYGDGGSTFRPLVSLDVVAHEMSHGTTAATAGLIYLGESGGLNEASSDIFGALAEFSAKNPSDKGDYLIGEKIVKVAPGFLRRMDRPAADAPLYGGTARSYNCWNPTIGREDVHFSSGPANHWFYLLAEGSGAKVIGGRQHNSPTCNGLDVNGIGRGAAGQIWYRAMNIYLTSTSNYVVARDATVRAAQDLYGTGSTQCRRVLAAWNAVGVPGGDWTCAGSPPAQGTNVVGNPGFESGNTVWTASPGVITTGVQWFPRSGSWYAWMNGYGTAHVDSTAQVITVPNSPTAKLRFWLLINSAEPPGGGVYDTLQVRVDNGAVTTLATYSNENANDTYTRRTVDLSAYAGQTVTLTFYGQEDGFAQTSYLLDDIRVTPN